MLFFLRNLALLHLLGLELYLLGIMPSVTPDLSAMLIVYGLFMLTPRTAAALLLPLALMRGFFYPGSTLFHVWLLLIVFLACLPIKRFLFAERWYWQVLFGTGVAFLLSLLEGQVLTGDVVSPLGRGAGAFLLTGLLMPVVLYLLCLLRVFMPGGREGPRRLVEVDA